MSDAVTVEIADAIVAELNAATSGTFSAAFTAARHYLPVFPLKEMGNLHVSVVPKAIGEEIHTRDQGFGTYSVDIAVQQKVTPATLAELDALVLLVEEIAAFFRLRRLTQYQVAAWVGTEPAPLYSMDDLDERQLFTSVMTLSYQVPVTKLCLAPDITNVTGYEGPAVTIAGINFYNEEGTIEMFVIGPDEWTEANVTSWTNTQVVCDNVVGPWCLLRLTNSCGKQDTYDVCG